MTYNEARKLAIRDLLDEGVTVDQIIAAGEDGYEGNLDTVIEIYTDRHLSNVKDAKEAA